MRYRANIILCALLFLSSITLDIVGQDLASKQDLLKSTCRIRSYSPEGLSLGSGVVVKHHGEYSYILSCAHLFRALESEPRPFMCQVEFFNDSGTESYPGIVVKYSYVHSTWNQKDLTLIQIPRVDKRAFYVFSATVQSAEILISGCPLGTEPVITKGDVGYNSEGFTATSCPAIFGNSGSAVFDDKFRIVGVLVRVLTYDQRIGYSKILLMRAHPSKNIYIHKTFAISSTTTFEFVHSYFKDLEESERSQIEPEKIEED